jgi:hypothetical protein
MLALDRDEAELSEECTPWHPLVLRAIRQVIKAAAAKDRPVSVCGEEGVEPGFACLLAGLGVRELSLSPGRAARVRHVAPQQRPHCPLYSDCPDDADRVHNSAVTVARRVIGSALRREEPRGVHIRSATTNIGNGTSPLRQFDKLSRLRLPRLYRVFHCAWMISCADADGESS